mgnify:CR=1 FL=1
MTDLVSGDTGSKLSVTVKDNAGAIVDLTGATVKFRWLGNDNLIKEVDAGVTDAPNGVVQYAFLAGDIIAPEMKIEVEVTDSGGLINTSVALIDLTVREQLG